MRVRIVPARNSTDERPRMELLKSVYEQHWLHARHVENERLWFTNIFGVIVAGLLAVLFTSDGDGTRGQFAVYAGYLILILSLVGYFLCLTWRAPFIEHTTLANRVLEASGLRRYAPYVSEAYRVIKIGWVSAHEIFLYFYGITAGLGLLLGLSGLDQETGSLVFPNWWPSAVVFAVLSLSWRGLALVWAIAWKVPRRFRLLGAIERTALSLGRRVSNRVPILRTLWHGLVDRERRYRKDMGVGER